ncbi:MAG: hypothetical protein JNK82_14765 [Myxococcaceae bacterium]|nr:hypothetical protein [Myxococcaceae bacterium]
MAKGDLKDTLERTTSAISKVEERLRGMVSSAEELQKNEWVRKALVECRYCQNNLEYGLDDSDIELLDRIATAARHLERSISENGQGARGSDALLKAFEDAGRELSNQINSRHLLEGNESATGLDRNEDLAGKLAAAKRIVGQLQRLRAEARDLVGGIGESAQGGGYDAMAAAAERTSLYWQIGTFAAIGIGVLIVASIIAGVLPPISSDVNGIAAAVARLAVVLSAAVVSRYCALMASRSQRERLWAKQRSLELKALTAYLEPFEPEAQIALRTKLVEKYFGVGSTLLAEVSSADTTATSSHDMVIDLLRALISSIPSDSVGGIIKALNKRTPQTSTLSKKLSKPK